MNIYIYIYLYIYIYIYNIYIYMCVYIYYRNSFDLPHETSVILQSAPVHNETEIPTQLNIGHFKV